jgi:NADH dehydrogenase
MKILLTGATGLVGRHLLPHLLDAGHAVRVLVRPGRESALRKPDLSPFDRMDRIEIVTGDLKNVPREQSADVVEWMRPVVRGVECVIHLGAAPRTANEEDMRTVNIYGTRELVRAVKKANIRRFLHFSSAECSDNLVYNVFRDTKKASEKPVRGNNLEWTVFRPAPIYGPGDVQFLGPMIQKIEKGLSFDIPGDGRIKVAPVHAEDVARAVVATLRPEVIAVDAVFHLASAGIAYDDMLKAVGEIAGRAPKIRHSSLKFNENWLKIVDLFTKNPEKQKALSERRNDLRFFLKDHLYPTADAEQQIEFKARDFATGVRESCKTPWWKS